MDRGLLTERLGVAPGGDFWVVDYHLFAWGDEVVFDCRYELAGEPAVPFQLVLSDCRELQWRVYAHLRPPEDQTLPATHVVNLRLGQDQHRKPLHLLTDAFGLSVTYGTLAIKPIRLPE